MDNNLLSITQIVEYIETHLDEKLDLESLAHVAGYSKYHLHRMFTNIVGLTVHSYVQRRRLTEAARALIFTNQSIMEIALTAGYETQQSFTTAFKTMFDCSPQELRKKRDFYPLQLKFNVDGRKQLRGDMIMDIKIIESGKILLVGYTANTKYGFSVIGECMGKLIANKDKIVNRSNKDYLNKLFLVLLESRRILCSQLRITFIKSGSRNLPVNSMIIIGTILQKAANLWMMIGMAKLNTLFLFYSYVTDKLLTNKKTVASIEAAKRRFI